MGKATQFVAQSKDEPIARLHAQRRGHIAVPIGITVMNPTVIEYVPEREVDLQRAVAAAQILWRGDLGADRRT